MLRKGFVERQIEMLGAVLRLLCRMREGGDAAGALAEINRAGREAAGLDVSTLARLTDDALFAHLGGGAEGAARCLTLGRLMAERARIVGGAEAGALRAKALTLLLRALTQEARLRTPEQEGAVEELLAQVPGAGLSPAARDSLARFREGATVPA